MIFRRTSVELTAAERRLYRSLREDVDVDPVHEDRTVDALRAADVFDAPSHTSWRQARAAKHRAPTIAAVAAIVVAIAGTSTLLETRWNESRRPPLDSAGVTTTESAPADQIAQPVPRTECVLQAGPMVGFLRERMG